MRRSSLAKICSKSLCRSSKAGSRKSSFIASWHWIWWGVILYRSTSFGCQTNSSWSYQTTSLGFLSHSTCLALLTNCWEVSIRTAMSFRWKLSPWSTISRYTSPTTFRCSILPSASNKCIGTFTCTRFTSTARPSRSTNKFQSASKSLQCARRSKSQKIILMWNVFHWIAGLRDCLSKCRYAFLSIWCRIAKIRWRIGSKFTLINSQISILQPLSRW